MRDLQGGPATSFEVWPENADTVAAFLRLQTQWIVGPMGGLVGMNYQGIAAMFDILQTSNRSEIFEGLQIMEQAVVSVLSKRKE